MPPMPEMPPAELRQVTPWEIRLMLRAAEGLTYREIAEAEQCSLRRVHRTFEGLREKLRPYGGGTKAGLVHWIDTHLDAWIKAAGIEVRKDA